MADPDTDHVRLPDQVPIPDARVRQYLHFEQQALNAYAKLGHMEQTLTHERMFAYTTLRYIGYEKEARSFLDSLTYPDSILQKARSRRTWPWVVRSGWTLF